MEDWFRSFHNPATKDLLGKLLVKDPKQRLASVTDIMQHPFFASIDWQRMEQRQCATPYQPQVKGPLDLSHFEAEQTNQPVGSQGETPPSSYENQQLNDQHQQVTLRMTDMVALAAQGQEDEL